MRGRTYRYMEKAASRVYGGADETRLSIAGGLIRFGSWIGGDRDGNPFVTPDTTRMAILMQAEEILAELGESPRSRATYYRGKLEIISHLALHERPHRIIADIVKTILDRQGRDWEDFGSTTLKRPPVAGVEPDTGQMGG